MMVHGIRSSAEDWKAFNKNLPTEAGTPNQPTHVLLWENDAVTETHKN